MSHAATSMGRRLARPFAVLTVGLTMALAVLMPSPASAHSLDSSTISAHVSAEGVDATISVALETLDDALGADYVAQSDVTGGTDAIVDYIADHLTVTGADGAVWGESFSNATRTSVEGIDSFTVDVAFDTGGADASTFTIAYDAIIEAIPGHEAVVVLTDPDGDVSTPGVITASDDRITIDLAGSAATTSPATGILDMIGYGFHHVLEGADHLLFLTALLLTAPVIVAAGRWRRRTELAPTARRVLAIVTSFTVGHSITLIASAAGWVEVPTTPVEVLVALSVAVAAVHAIRPLLPHGETLIAGGFGLVHGLAFAGILVDLGLDGSASLLALLAFNVGVELAQLLATALLFPSLYLLARTRWYPPVRVIGGGIAVAAAAAWIFDRLGVLSNPLSAVEDAAVEHPWPIVVGLATLAVVASGIDRRRPKSSPSSNRHDHAGRRSHVDADAADMPIGLVPATSTGTAGMGATETQERD